MHRQHFCDLAPWSFLAAVLKSHEQYRMGHDVNNVNMTAHVNKTTPLTKQCRLTSCNAQLHNI